jgi:predicted patatin/cPLA2 family phospholipase
MAYGIAITSADLILQRAQSGSRPGHRTDAFIVGLCIEGGGMRGVVSAGMVTAIEELGLLPAFDRVYGASAGAMNAAYLLAGHAKYGTTIYSEDINTRAFIDLTRPLRGKAIVDVDFVTDQVMVRAKPLDCDRVLTSAIPLSIVASDADTGTHVVLRPTSAEDLRGALRAGATMPLVARGPHRWHGRRLWDASMTEPIPARVARADGCTHIVVLLTRPAGVLRPRIGLFERCVFLPRLARSSPALARRYEHGAADYRALLDSLDGDATALLIRPRGPAISKLEKNAARLIAGAADGTAAVVSAFGQRPAL